jgi:dephospho-CoA kinase
MRTFELGSVELTVGTGDDQEAIPIENATLNNTMNADYSTYDLRDDTVEQLIEVLEEGLHFSGVHGKVMNNDRRAAVAGRLRQQKPNRRTTDAVAFCGLPGAGKSHTAEKLATVYDTEVVSMGDAIRHKYKEENWLGKPESQVPDEIPSKELADFAAEWRAEAPEEIPAKTAEMARVLEKDVAIIDGVRSPNDAEILSDEFDSFYLIEIQCGFEERLRRLQDRGREGESDFDRVDLAERDMNELENLGYAALQDGDYKDLTITNGEHNNLTINLSNLVENNLPFEIKNGKPLGLDGDLEAFRRGELSAAEFADSK